MRAVLIENGVVMQKAAPGRTAEQLGQGWVDAPDDVSPGFIFDGETFALPALTLAELKAAKVAQVNAHRDAAFAAGFTVAGTGTALDGHVLQTRNDEDRTNWLTAKDGYNEAVEEGFGGVSGATFRTADNTTVQVTFTQGRTILRSMAAWAKQVMGNSWVLKDAIEAAADQTELDAIDFAAGWP